MDLKKRLLDLADSVRYWDMYDLTVVPNVLQEASELIGKLELEIISMNEKINMLESELIVLAEKLEETEAPQSYSTDKIELYPQPEEPSLPKVNGTDLKRVSDRAKIKEKLDEMGIVYSLKDNTHRLRRKLQRALHGG